MFISVNRSLLRQCLGYAFTAGITALFGAVYEHFSHQVYSMFMLYAFAIPLVLGTLPLLCIACAGKQIPEGSWCFRLQGFSIATLTVGSLLQGVLEIYGTTNHWMTWYWCVGLGLLLMSALLYGKQLLFKR